MLRRKAVLMVTALFATACISFTPTSGGTPIDETWVQKIEKGKTTMDDVRTRMGKPASLSRSPDYEVWTYQHWEGKPAVIGEGYRSMTTQSLVIRFKDGKVVDYSLSSAAR